MAIWRVSLAPNRLHVHSSSRRASQSADNGALCIESCRTSLIQSHRAVTRTDFSHTHWPPMAGATSSTTWITAFSAPRGGFGSHRYGSESSSTTHPVRNRSSSIENALVAAVAAAAPASPVEVPPVPAIGSTWASREAFKAAANAHGVASRPSFGLTTIVRALCLRGRWNALTRRTIGQQQYLVETLSHLRLSPLWLTSRSQGTSADCHIALDTLPYAAHSARKYRATRCSATSLETITAISYASMVRMGVSLKASGVLYLRRPLPSSGADTSHRTVTDACYRHEQHRDRSPPPRKGAWTVRERPLTRGPRKPKGNGVGPVRKHSKSSSSGSSKKSQEPVVEEERGGTLFRSPSPVVDLSIPLPVFVASLHPLLAVNTVSQAIATLLSACGVTDTPTLLSLTTAETTTLFTRFTPALPPAQLAVLRNRIAPLLTASATVCAATPNETLADALARLHPSLFSHIGEPHVTPTLLDALQRAGLDDAASAKQCADLRGMLKDVQEGTEVQRVVLGHRAHLL